MLKKADFILVICLIVFAVSFLFIFDLSGNKTGGQVLISVDGAPYMTLDMREHDGETFLIESDGGSNTVRISDGKIRITKATCKDKICVRQGSVSKNNETIVCLPNRVVVEIKSDDFNEVDAILR